MKRKTKPRRLTKNQQIIADFIDGKSMEWLEFRHGVSLLEVERIIRREMRKVELARRAR